MCVINLSRKKRIDSAHAKKIMDHYDLVAAEYVKSDAFAEPVIKDILRCDLSEQNPVAILDLGCGSGRYLSLTKNIGVVGIDLSRNILIQAKKHGVDLVQGEIHNLPFRPSTFDFVYCISLLGEILPLSEVVLDEIIRVMQKDCFFVFTVVPKSVFRLIKKLLFFLSQLTGVSILSPFSDTTENIATRLRYRGFRVLDIRLIKGRIFHYYVRATYNC